MEILNVSFTRSRKGNLSDSEDSDDYSDSNESRTVNMTHIKLDKNFLEDSMREEYDDKLREKDDTIDDLRYELEKQQKRNFDDFRKYNALNNNFNDYKKEANSKINDLKRQVDRYRVNYNNYLDMKDRNEDLEDENYDLNNEINRLKRDASYNNSRYNRLLAESNSQQNYLYNQLNQYKQAQVMNANNMMLINQQYNMLYQEKERLNQLNNLKDMQIMQLQQQLAKANQGNDNITNNFNNFPSNYDVGKNINSYNNYSNEIIIKIVSMDQSIEKEIKCYENQSFQKVEESFLEMCPQLRNKKITFLANGNKVSKYKSVKENNIINGIKVICIINENDNNDNIYNNYYNNNYDENNYHINNSNYNSDSNNNQNITYSSPLNNSSNNVPLAYTTIATNTNPLSYNTYNELPTYSQVPEINTYTTTTMNESSLPNNYISSIPIYIQVPEINATTTTTTTENQLPYNSINAIPTYSQVPELNTYITTSNQSTSYSVVPSSISISNQNYNNNYSTTSTPTPINIVPVVSSQNISLVPLVNTTLNEGENSNYTSSNSTTQNYMSVVPFVYTTAVPISVVPIVQLGQVSENNNYNYDSNYY